MSISKGRLGGKAWFYAQGQRAYHLMMHGPGAPGIGPDIPQWGRDAHQKGYWDAMMAAGRKLKAEEHGNRTKR